MAIKSINLRKTLEKADGVATPKLVYRRLREATPESSTKGGNGQNQVDTNKWSRNAILKVKNFIWRATHKAIPVQEVLVRRGVHVTQTCPFCDGTEIVSYAI